MTTGFAFGYLGVSLNLRLCALSSALSTNRTHHAADINAMLNYITTPRPRSLQGFALAICLVLFAAGCSDDEGGTSASGTSGTDDTSGTSGTDDTPTATEDGTSTATGDGTSSTSSGTDADNDSDDTDPGTDTSGGTDTDNDSDDTDPDVDDTADTSGDPCDALTCGPTEECQVGGDGEAACVDISCAQNADCAEDRFCDGTVCVSDLCAAGQSRCAADGLSVTVCAPDGSAEISLACEGLSQTQGQCVTDAQGQGRCGCQDDWDCPALMRCEVGVCAGTGLPPSCTLPPVPFQDVPPTNEIQWGGANRANPNATTSAYPQSAQVLSTPLVANLDDDNGDGLINELDFPEIIFTSYHGANLRANGVLRAIRGGGPNKGQDFFANCGPSTWHIGDDVADFQANCNTASAANGQAGSAIADLDGDGVPEVIYPGGDRSFTILNNQGDPIFTSPPDQWPLGGGWPATQSTPTPSVANIDGQSFAEVVFGNRIFTFAHDAGGAIVLVDRFDAPAGASGTNSHGPITCVADLNGDGRQDIIGGTVAYSLPRPPFGASKRIDCATFPPQSPEEQAFCDGQLLALWDASAVNEGPPPGDLGPIDVANVDGFCAVADVLGLDPAADPGPQNPLDGSPEVILISDGSLLILEGLTGKLRRYTDLEGGRFGGTPNIDDFDGDGFPEIATALENFYTVVDLQAPSADCPVWPNLLLDQDPDLNGNTPRTPGGACAADTDCNPGAFCRASAAAEPSVCTCYFNGWRQDTEDDSSRNTASSVFDFNGDGAAEVVYNDECFFRIYNGLDGQVLSRVDSLNRTTIENPVVADIDNDGNAEIVFSMNNETIQCAGGSNQLPNGIGVWGDATDTWVSARRIWNQHAYHITNITEDGRVPTQETPSWTTYNTYRSNPRSFGVAPDLVVTGVQVFSPDAACGQLSTLITVNVEVRNQGDLRVGPGVVVTLRGEWAGASEDLLDAAGQPLRFVLQNSLEPGSINRVSFSYDAAANDANPDTLPDRIFAAIDSEGLNDFGRERECREDNNVMDVPVVGGSGARADLSLTLDTVTAGLCPSIAISATVRNDGNADAAGVIVRFFAGNPEQGGTPLLDHALSADIPAGGSASFSIDLDRFLFTTVIYAVVDPDNTTPECDDANNTTNSIDRISCQIP